MLADEIDAFDGLERAHQLDVMTRIDSGSPIHRTEKPAHPPRHLVSYAVFVGSAGQ